MIVLFYKQRVTVNISLLGYVLLHGVHTFRHNMFVYVCYT